MAINLIRVSVLYHFRKFFFEKYLTVELDIWLKISYKFILLNNSGVRVIFLLL